MWVLGVVMWNYGWDVGFVGLMANGFVDGWMLKSLWMWCWNQMKKRKKGDGESNS